MAAAIIDSILYYHGSKTASGAPTTTVNLCCQMLASHSGSIVIID